MVIRGTAPRCPSPQPPPPPPPPPLQKRLALAKQLKGAFDSGGSRRLGGNKAAAAAAASAALSTMHRGYVVHRHLLDGDIMLTNRQPTLHKPGLMAHK